MATPSFTYDDLLRTCAFYGMTNCPITERGFSELVALGYDLDTLYEVACDILCGFTFKESAAANTPS